MLHLAAAAMSSVQVVVVTRSASFQLQDHLQNSLCLRVCRQGSEEFRNVGHLAVGSGNNHHASVRLLFACDLAAEELGSL